MIKSRDEKIKMPKISSDTVSRINVAESYYSDVIMGAVASQITSLTIAYSAVCLDADQR